MTASNASLLHVFGEEVLSCPSTQKTAKAEDVLANKVVLLYFSAQWCSPCSRFTPLLSELYEKQKRKAVEDFEVLFVSLDKNETAYQRYSATMPWWCLHFTSRLLTKLANLYTDGELGIPLLVVLDTDGTILVRDGVGNVITAPEDFPWRPRPLPSLLPKEYTVGTHGQHLSRRPMRELDDKYLMLYFSASWCPPCRKFTPKLSTAYQELRKVRDDFELLLVSSDRDQESFDEYFSTMSFGAIEFAERQAKADLSMRLQVRVVPTLVILGPVVNGDRVVINNGVRGMIEDGDYIADFPFQPKRYGNLEVISENVNSCRCLIVFHEGGDDDEQEDLIEAMKLACENTIDKDLRFFWATSPSYLSTAMRDALQLGPVTAEPVLALLDVPGYYVCSRKDVSIDGILSFVENPGERIELLKK